MGDGSFWHILYIVILLFFKNINICDCVDGKYRIITKNGVIIRKNKSE